MIKNSNAYILEEFTRFGGGQVVFERIHSTLEKIYRNVKVVTDKEHPLIPGGISQADIIETNLFNPPWGKPIRMIPKIIKLKNELKIIPPNAFSFNNHPNVFIFNATINFGHELFGFMDNNENFSNNLKLSLIKKLGIFKEYEGSYFLTHGDFTSRQLKNTFSKLGISNVRIEKLDLPVDIPKNVSLKAKENIVLTFGRISRDKNLEKVITIARNLSNIKFIISGRVLDNDLDYANELIKKKPLNVHIIINPDRESKDLLFRKSKVYLHTKKNENYGISVAEAISYGCYPIVPQDSGSFEDILMNGYVGSGYKTNEEAQNLISTALDENNGELEYIYNTRERFKPETFETNLRLKINKIF